eukprot:CAMPEP_0119321780 /NCGR_PEP_ID=MMETSP1333-20130426/56417_1 /TAXON_ID=418940 /ORGANISM="Scyphosphaera apsteinii, Strain RCC1455" /LENGTH=521 /DNA_ID=CAMNT_0007328835 /DNA_START=14 /DNA_END=1576 /DNA_ORIENTATION=-
MSCCRALRGLLLLAATYGDEYSHRYETGESLSLWVNKVGPYHNPQETYVYYSLPFCSTKPVDQLEHRWDALGEVLEGNDLISSGYAVQFKQPVSDRTKICTLHLGSDTANQLQYAVRNHYWYQLYLDDLPIWGMVGELTISDMDENDGEPDAVADGETLVYTHKKFSISYNSDRIIQVNLTSEDPVELTPGKNIDFTYSVEWAKTDTPFHRRFDRYLDYDFFEHQIHWFSIFNSFMMVIFLTGIVSLILMRTLRKDYAKYAREAGDLDDLDQELDESGWKQVHGDVFRPPGNLCLFCALVGTGAQLATLVLFMILFATATTLYMGRGAIIVSFLVCYCITSLVAGYTSGALYSRCQGKSWIRTMLYTVAIFPGLCFSLTLLLNTVALAYGSLANIPFTSTVSVVLIWLFVSCPLCVIGTLVGRNWSGTSSVPCRVNAIPRLIPDKRWYARPPVLISLGGVLPFGSIFIEMYFVFTSFWNYKFYYVYGFMFLVYLILVIVTVCVTIVVTYFLLNNEDYRWPW